MSNNRINLTSSNFKAPRKLAPEQSRSSGSSDLFAGSALTVHRGDAGSDILTNEKPLTRTSCKHTLDMTNDDQDLGATMPKQSKKDNFFNEDDSFVDCETLLESIDLMMETTMSKPLVCTDIVPASTLISKDIKSSPTSHILKTLPSSKDSQTLLDSFDLFESTQSNSSVKSTNSDKPNKCAAVRQPTNQQNFLTNQTWFNPSSDQDIFDSSENSSASSMNRISIDQCNKITNKIVPVDILVKDNYFESPSFKQDGHASSEFNSSKAVENILKSVSPSMQSAGRLSDRLKRTLRNNARMDTPVIRKQLPKTVARQDAEVTLTERTVSTVLPMKNEHCLNYMDDEFDIGPFYGLPSKVKDLLKTHRSIAGLYDWQNECLCLKSARNGENLIYSLPTSGGKTLVAELLILRQLLCLQKDALLILPFVAIVQEKVRGLSPFAVELDFIVEEYAASKGQIPPRDRRKRHCLYVATIEKGSSLVNSLIEIGRIQQLGLVVVDELHMLGEGGSRGAVLEMTLTKLMHTSPRTQIVGMSATLSNISDLTTFLKAQLYTNDFRPVELVEYVKLSDVLYRVNSSALCPDDTFQFSRLVNSPVACSDSKHLDPDQIHCLVMEVIPQHSCLIFCPTKKNCENVAQLLCKLMPKSLREVKVAERRALRHALQSENSGQLCPVLRNTVVYGVAYHHSGLTMDERRLIEEAYLDGVLCVLTCTSTLAAGVNLPAKRVIVRSPYVGTSFLTRSQYKQMTGRAGRAGLDSSGESIIILTPTDKHKMSELIGSSFDQCRSSLLYESHKGLRSLMLTAIGLKITTSVEDVNEFLTRTLCYVQREQLQVNILDVSQDALRQLAQLGLVVEKPQRQLEVTRLGRAVFKGSIDVERSARLCTDLRTAQQTGLVIDTYLHLLYLVTPYEMCLQVNVDWMTFINEMARLTVSELKVAEQIGITDAFMSKKVRGKTILPNSVDDLTATRFYLALMLLQLWKQRTIWDVSIKFQQPRGFIQHLLTGAASFASCVNHFCQELDEFWAYQDLLGNFVKKLSYCCSMELIPLMEIPGVKMGRARQLYTVGLKSLQDIARAEPLSLVKSIEHMSHRVARQIVASAQMLLTEKVEALREEADSLCLSKPSVATTTVAATDLAATTTIITTATSEPSVTTTTIQTAAGEKS